MVSALRFVIFILDIAEVLKTSKDYKRSMLHTSEKM